MYAGTMVQGRRRKVSYKSEYVVSVPPSEWFVVENTHEAIIDRDMFDTVQRMINNKRQGADKAWDTDS